MARRPSAERLECAMRWPDLLTKLVLVGTSGRHPERSPRDILTRSRSARSLPGALARLLCWSG